MFYLAVKQVGGGVNSEAVWVENHCCGSKYLQMNIVIHHFEERYWCDPQNGESDTPGPNLNR